EMDRMARDTRQPDVLHELFEALGNDPFVIAECLARPVLAERLIKEPDGNDSDTLSRLQTVSLIQERPIAENGRAIYTLPVIADGTGCIDDTWAPINSAGAPEGRSLHTAVWTGSEMIVWGGIGNTPSPTATATPTGSPTATPVPYLNTGARYNPATDSW